MTERSVDRADLIRESKRCSGHGQYHPGRKKAGKNCVLTAVGILLLTLSSILLRLVTLSQKKWTPSGVLFFGTGREENTQTDSRIRTVTAL